MGRAGAPVRVRSWPASYPPFDPQPQPRSLRAVRRAPNRHLVVPAAGTTVARSLPSLRKSGRAAGPQRRGGTYRMDSGDTAWMLASTALVMIMLPGLALFY